MHAHNINLAQYGSAKRLLQKVNVELDDVIGKLIGAKEENESITPADFNSTLGSAWSSILKPELVESVAKLGKIAQLKDDILPATNALRELAD